MCAAHWRSVPGDLSKALYRAFARRKRGDAGARAEHAQAMEDCIAHVEGREPRELFGGGDDG